VPPPKIEAVRIGCEGEVRELDVPKFQPISIFAYDEAFRHDTNFSILSRFIGIPLAARKLPLNTYWSIELRNPEATALFRNCDIGAQLNDDDDGLDFGATPEEWTVDVGPVIVARIDGKPFHPLHAAAVSAFCSRYMHAPFQHCVELEQSWRRMCGSSRELVFEQRRAVLAEAASGKFAEFFEQYKQNRVRGRPDLMGEGSDFDHVRRMDLWTATLDEVEPRPEWKDVPSPFDV
jgi:hypothetical protein